MTRDQIIAAAREWVGTPWHHQGRLKGVGVDCIGLVVGVLADLGITVEDTTNYSRFPDGVTLGREIGRQLIEVRGARPGDVMLFRITRLPQHVAIRTRDGIIHAHQGAGKVVETSLPVTWSHRIVACYAFPGVDGWPS